jgi:membrane protease subunit HflK
MLEEAEAYRAEVVARAEGESQRFEQLLTEYQRAPDVTRERLYIETVEAVMASASKVMVDVDGGNNMLYLPLDRMIQSSGTSSTRTAPGQVNMTPDVMRQITENVARELGRSSPTSIRREVR